MAKYMLFLAFLLIYFTNAIINPGYISSSVQTPIGSQNEILLSFIDKTSINVEAQPMNTITSFGIDQFFGNTWNWAFSYKYTWSTNSSDYLKLYKKDDICDIYPPKEETGDSVESATEQYVVNDLDFLGHDLFFIDNATNSLRVKEIIWRNERFSYVGESRNLDVNSSSLISCNSNREAFCLIYLLSSQLCRLHKKDGGVDISDCINVKSGPVRLVLLNSNRAVLYYVNGVKLFSTDYDKPLKELSEYTGGELYDVAALWNNYLAVCRDNGISIISENLFSSKSVTPQFETPCKRIASYENTIIAYQDIIATNISRNFLREFLVTDRANSNFVPVREWNISNLYDPDPSTGYYDPWNMGNTISMLDPILKIDDKYAYLHVKEIGLYMIRHSLPQQMPSHSRLLPQKGQNFALCINANKDIYGYETGNYMTITNTVINTGRLYLFYPYKLSPGALSCDLSKIATLPKLTLELSLEGNAANCKSKLNLTNSFNTHCKISRTVLINQKYEEPDEGTNMLIYLIFLIPVILIAGCGIFFMGGRGSSENNASTNSNRQPINLVSVKQYEEAGIRIGQN